MLGVIKRRMFNRHQPAAERLIGVKTLKYWGGASVALLLWFLMFGVVNQVSNGVQMARASIDKGYKVEVMPLLKPMNGLEVIEDERQQAQAPEQERTLTDRKRDPIQRPERAQEPPKPPETLDSHLNENYPLQMQAFEEREQRLKVATTDEERELIHKIYDLKFDFAFAVQRNKRDTARELARKVKDLEAAFSELLKKQNQPAITLQLSPDDAAKFNNSLSQ